MKNTTILLMITTLLALAACQASPPEPSALPPTPSSLPPTATPTPPAQIAEEEVFFSFRKDQLRGILTLPAGDGPFPALVLISGSADTSTGKRSGVTASYLSVHARRIARVGFAVLRYDPPGVGKSSGEAGFETMQQRSEEALAAISYLQSRQEIQQDRIGLWGISQGGWVIAIAAAEDPQNVAFIISVSGSGISVAEQQVYGIEHESRQANLPEEDVTKAILIGRLLIDWQLDQPLFQEINTETARSLGEGPWTEFMALVYGSGEISPAESLPLVIGILERIQDEPWTRYIYLKDLYLPRLRSITPDQAASLRAVVGPALREDPMQYLAEVTSPVLAVFGEDDPLQPSLVSAALFEQYLTEAGNQQFQIVVLPGEDHGSFITKSAYFDLLTGWLADLY